MRQLKLTILLFTCLLLTAARCKKSDTPTDELSKLPPETQTGANTFGALVNGQAFIPKTSIFNGSPLQCNYIYLNGGYYFTASADFRSYNPDYINSILIQTENLPISKNTVIPLLQYNTNGMASGSYNVFYNTSTDYHRTNATVTGELHITYLDEIKQVVSGTFSFDAVNNGGEKVEVRNGRFDMQFTK